MKTLKLLMICIILTCTSCGKDIQGLVDKQVSTMSEMAELGTVEYTISKIIKVNDKSFYTIGDRKILFSCKAVAKAGIDLKEFRKENVKYDRLSNSINIKLPSPKLLAFNMPAEHIKLEYIKVGTFRKDFNTEERNNFLQQGEEDIKANIETIGIFEDAKNNAKLFFETLFKQMNVSAVNIEFI